MSKTVVIFGTGATIASNYKKCCNTLPGDKGFFNNCYIKSHIQYLPALEIMLNSFYSQQEENKWQASSLEAFWTFLDFCDQHRAIYSLDDIKKEWWHKVNGNSSYNKIIDELHCDVRRYIENKSMRTNNDFSEIDLTLLVGWELRILLKKVYSNLEEPKEKDDTYFKLLNKLFESKDDISFITLNYDCLLEKTLEKIKQEKWFYPHIKSCKGRLPDGIKVLKLHGSLNWKMKGNINFEVSTDYSDQPVNNITRTANDFEQAGIIAPTQVKADLHKKETQDPLWVNLLRETWKSAQEDIFKADKIIVIGYSIPPTDYHIDWLLRMANHVKLSSNTYPKFDEVTYCFKENKENVVKRMEDQIKLLLYSKSYKFFPNGLDDYIKRGNARVSKARSEKR